MPGTDGVNKPHLKMVGEDGNIFAILGRARVIARRAGWSHQQIADMTQSVTQSKSYDGALQVLMHLFEVY